MSSSTTPVVFSDINPEVGSVSRYELVYNETAIRQSVLTILSTRKNTRPFRRNFGSYVMDMLFDPMDDFTATRLKTEMLTAIQEWEPRIVMKSSTCIPDYDNQRYFVQLEFQIPRLNNKSVSLAFNLATQG